MNNQEKKYLQEKAKSLASRCKSIKQLNKARQLLAKDNPIILI